MKFSYPPLRLLSIALKNFRILLLALIFLSCTDSDSDFKMAANAESDTDSKIAANAESDTDSKIAAKRQYPLTKNVKSASGWIVDLKWTLNKDQVVKEFSTEWVVPQVPAKQQDQIIFYFPGLHEVAILQPVLQWGKSAIGGGKFWNVASWYVETAFGPYKTSPFVKVKPGDRCKATMFYKGYNGKTYQYESHIEVNGIPQEPLVISSKFYLKNVYLTLEDYKIDSCKKHSASGEFKFENIVIKGDKIPEIIPWEKFVNPHTLCNENITVVKATASEKNPGEVVISFGSTK